MPLRAALSHDWSRSLRCRRCKAIVDLRVPHALDGPPGIVAAVYCEACAVALIGRMQWAAELAKAHLRAGGA